MSKLSYLPSETVCFTGHRMIPPEEVSVLRQKIRTSVQEAYERRYRVFICGGARGFDTIAAQEVLLIKNEYDDIRLVIAVPCASQADRWPQREKEIYQSILNRADEVIILSEEYYTGCMQNRNRYMVDNSSLCLCYLKSFEGGTWSTVRYALHKGISLKNLAMQNDSVVLKEHSWSFICIYHFVLKNVSIVHLYHSGHPKNKSQSILKRS